MWLYGKILQNVDRYPEMAWIFHVPNGGWRTAKTAGKLKAQGVKPGVPDYVWPLPRGEHHGCWIEMKRVRSGALESKQKLWRDWLIAQGYYWEMCRGSAHAWERLLWYYHLPTPGK
jgi:hypothetical protein